MKHLLVMQRREKKELKVAPGLWIYRGTFLYGWSSRGGVLLSNSQVAVGGSGKSLKVQVAWPTR